MKIKKLNEFLDLPFGPINRGQGFPLISWAHDLPFLNLRVCFH